MRNVWILLFIVFNFLRGASQESVTIYFENDAFQVETKHFPTLDSIITIKNPKINNVCIKGYANAYGTSAYNQRLSLKRAQSVASYFQNAGAVVDSIQAYGETSSFRNTSRKVVIKLYKEPIIKTQEAVSQLKVEDVSIDHLVVGEKIVFKNLNFVGGTDVPLFKSQAYLIELFEYLRDHPKVKVKFIGHICCHGTMNPKTDGMNTRTNQRSLSTDRAKAVYDYMVNSGIAKARLSYEGRAYTEPLGKIPADDRRVEIELMAN